MGFPVMVPITNGLIRSFIDRTPYRTTASLPRTIQLRSPCHKTTLFQLHVAALDRATYLIECRRDEDVSIGLAQTSTPRGSKENRSITCAPSALPPLAPPLPSIVNGGPPYHDIGCISGILHLSNRCRRPS
ncbi:hypothetical protein GWI33_007492 [Rhynchophorus ferrugineus]|uniref:Uncharacterized protein n=1 Tax=Rhynchophorus ferrugineus TaxID=354439 RepID=A0A834MGM0_RHYFE|nr:hypothetical protein GWI33_007492 [Rhynchophorus ferrugineus]